MKNLSVVLATRNEEANIKRCLSSIKNIADEIILFDEHSSDNTREIALSFGAQVFEVDHEPIFHVTKQKAINKATGKWILQLDADEVVTESLANEILSVIAMDNEQILKRKPVNASDDKLFNRHLSLLEQRDGKMGKNGSEVVAFLIPRMNMFLGHPLIHGGVYPDGVIRLIKNGRAHLPAKSVHEQMEINGKVAWLYNPLEHWDSPTLSRYLWRLNRYTDLQAEEFVNQKISKNSLTLLLYTTFYPVKAFVIRYFRHRGYADGMYGFVWATFSAWHYPIAYLKYILK